jgi:PAS domain S-box-containing protein
VIVELAPDAILAVDERGHILMANRATEAMFGYDRETLLRIGVDALVPEGHRRAHRGHRLAYNAAPEMRPMGLGLDLWGRRADGSEFPVEISLSPVTGREGTRVVAIVREATAHRAVELAAGGRLIVAEDERITADLHERVIRHLFAASLTIKAVLGQVEHRVAERLAAVTDELDLAIRDIRNTVIRRAWEPPDDPTPPRTANPNT